MRAIRGTQFGSHALRAALVMMTVGFAAGAARAQFDLFKWTFKDPSGEGSGSLDSGVMKIVGPDGLSCSDGIASYTTVAPYALTVVANYDVIAYDKLAPGWDLFITLTDGVDTEVEDGSCFGCQVMFTVPAGSTFGFGIKSKDCHDGPSVVTITDFQVEPAKDVLLLPGKATFEEFGSALAAVGDADGDGAPDVLVGAPFAGVPGLGTGRVAVHSSLTQLPLLEIVGAAEGGMFGAAVCAGDIDADGMDDLVVGAPTMPSYLSGPGDVRVYSGANAGVLWHWSGPQAGEHFGAAVAVPGDINLDGFPDVLVGAPQHKVSGAFDAGMARLFSGADGSVLASWGGDVAGDELGTDVDGAGDVDGDGVPDLIVGAPKVDVGGPDAGQARVFSGFNRSLIHDLASGCADPAGGLFGSSVAGIGDVDGDGLADLAVGAPGPYCSAADQDHGSLWVFSGARGNVLFFDSGPAKHDRLGFAVAAAGDVDGDGHPDVAAGAPSTDVVFIPGIGTARAYSGDDGVVLRATVGEVGDLYGASVAGLGDIDMDGLCDMGVGAPTHDGAGTSAGQVSLVRSAFLWTDLGLGLAGSLPAPQLTGHGLLAGGELTVFLDGAPPASPVFLIIGLAELDLPFKGGVLVPHPDAVFGAVTEPEGSYRLVFSQTGPLPPGQSFYFQAWVADAGGPAGWAASSALRATVP